MPLIYAGLWTKRAKGRKLFVFVLTTETHEKHANVFSFLQIIKQNNVTEISNKITKLNNR